MSERRRSARIQKLNSERSCPLKYVDEIERDNDKILKRKRSVKLNVVSKINPNKAKIVSKVKETAKAGVVTEVVTRNETEGGGATSVHAVVRAAIRSFYTHYLHFVQEEEKRCGKVEADKSVKDDSKTKKGDAPKDNTKNRSRRPELKALTKMIETGSALRPNRIGSIPGIDVGHQFLSRAEMVAAGCHNHWLNGIDYVGKNGSKIKDRSRYELPVTVAIVISGQYEDDLDNCEDVVYTGQGGNNLHGNKQQIRDQQLTRGNLGLKNSMDQGVHVRVIRGHKSKMSYVGKVYTYDGLYEVVKCRPEKGISGYRV